MCTSLTCCTDLSRIVDPLQGHVAENHGRQVCDRTNRIVRGPSRVDRLFGKSFQHDSRKRIVDHALHEHQRKGVRELFAVRAIRTSCDLLLEYAIEEIAHEYADSADGELRSFVHRNRYRYRTTGGGASSSCRSTISTVGGNWSRYHERNPRRHDVNTETYTETATKVRNAEQT